MFLLSKKNEKRRHPCLQVFLIGAAIFSLVIIGAVTFVYHSLRQPIAPAPSTTSTAPTLLDILPGVLGFDTPKTYLLLFENNTELRPGGGFIGSYAVVRMDHGKPDIVKIEGTETLDHTAQKDLMPKPPQSMLDYLGIDRWEFRDSNWSPDFATSAKQALAFYRLEKGVDADQIVGVIAVTPTVIEQLLARVGTITIQGVPFTADTVTEKLEYEVEYNYLNKGITTAQRKQILAPFMQELVARVAPDFILHSSDYEAMLATLAGEKQILIYSIDPALQAVAAANHWTGEIATSTDDYLLWVDANLGALKTDRVIDRHLDYAIARQSDGSMIATATMTYRHGGTVDWRTTRYRSYTRVFVPQGAELLSITGAGGLDAKKKVNEFDHGVEGGKTWFGAFVSVDPGTTKTLQFRYRLPADVAQSIARGAYTLLVQKEAGTLSPQLTLNLGFGTTVTGADPAESQDKWGDNQYQIATDLSVDREFHVLLAH